MCLLSIAWQVHPEYPLIFLGNRDEFHTKRSAAADWWDDNPEALGGRDLEAGGSWLGVNRAGRFAVVTNRPDLPAPETSARSRGELVNAWLGNVEPSAIDLLAERNSLYGGFSLLLAKHRKLERLSGGNGTPLLDRTEIQPGITGLSNTAPNDPWPKLNWLNKKLADTLNTGGPDEEQLMQFLLRTEPVVGSSAKDVSGLPFVTGDRYGTRSSTVVLINASGECLFYERRFGPGGRPQGVSRYCFPLRSSP